jgi:AcrR family transcriptional regulator
VTSATTPERSRPRGQHRASDESAAAILEAAGDLLAREGQSALTVRRIAAAAGGSTMNVYSRFGGKDGVIDALLIEGFEKLTEVIREAHASADAVDDLMTCARGYRTFALTHSTYYELMFDRAIPGYVMSPAAIAAAAASLGSLAERVQEAMDAGIIRADDPMEIATIFWSACHGPVSLELKFTGKANTDWTSVHRELIDAVIRGLAPDGPAGKANR